MNEADAAMVLARLLDPRPSWLVLREEEIKRGHLPVDVGSVEWFPVEDWHTHDCVSLTKHGEVRIVAIMARKPGTGAFTRMLTGIIGEGLLPIVVCPLQRMQEILEGWGWQHRETGSTFEDREDLWWPRRLRHALGKARAAPGTETPTDATDAAGGPASQQGDGNE